MNLEFRFVLFENEEYATEKGEEGVQEILAKKTVSGYIAENNSYYIAGSYTTFLHWWEDPKTLYQNYSPCYNSELPSWLTVDILRDRITKALEDWQKKYLLTNQDIKIICTGKHYLYRCNVEKICGDAEIYCVDTAITKMTDHAQAITVTGNSTIETVGGHARIKILEGNSRVRYLEDRAVISKMRDTSLIHCARGFSRVNTMYDNSRILTLTCRSSVGSLGDYSIIDYMNNWATVKRLYSYGTILNIKDRAQIRQIYARPADNRRSQFYGYNNLPFH